MESESVTPTYKAHVLVLPYPAQGHINPMLQFSKRLVARGLKATLVNTKNINTTILLDPNTPVHVESISDGFDEPGSTAGISTELYLSTLKEVGSRTLSNLITHINTTGSTPVTGIIYDGFLPWALDVAKKFGLYGVVFFTQSCAVNTVYYHVQRGLLPLPLEEPTVSFPGLPVLQASDTPSFVSDYGPYPGWFSLVVGQFVNVDDADWVLFNTFYELEKESVDWMRTQWRVGTIGPTLPSMYLDKRLEDDTNYGINLFTPNSTTCINWLQTKPPSSVVYVSFGSMAELGEEQMGEIARGLIRSNCYFLWVVRASEEAKLPPNILEEVAEKGLVVNWCSQMDVLVHESVGCFVTHCGLNSVLEAMSLGVPIVGIPQWSDQLTNAKFVADIWKIGVRAKADASGVVKGEVLEVCVKEVMEKGRELKENAKRWGNFAKEAVGEGGSSHKCIDEFVANLICCKK